MFGIKLLTRKVVAPHVIKKGDTAIVGKWDWIDVQNLHPVTQKFSNGQKPLVAGDTCGIEEGGVVTVIGVEGDRVLVRYKAPGSPMGTRCPSGVIFFVSKDTFLGMSETYKQVMLQKENERLIVEKLLRNE
jgi:hypothetical protein